MPTRLQLVLTQSFLEIEYLEKLKTPYVIADENGFNHKTVRSYLKKWGIKQRNASEYNSLKAKTYTEPCE